MSSSRPKPHTSQTWSQTDLNVLSSQRSGLFGLSILWLMLFHSTLSPAWAPLYGLKAMGRVGADMFLLLSGVGLYCSMERDPSPRRFWRKRAARVLLPYLVAAGVYECSRCLLGHQGWGEALQNLTFVSLFRTGELGNWFVAFLLPCYLAYPLLYRAVKSRRRWLWALLLLGGAWASPVSSFCWTPSSFSGSTGCCSGRPCF